ncbi:hypothetical protein BN3589_00702 [Clostridium sp. C105KSO14]|nr:hypothetical protein BN3589_00702 [Clostridium sp. C105KSO14]
MYKRQRCVFFFQAEDGIRDAQESRGLGDVYKRQAVKQAEVQTRSSYVVKIEAPSVDVHRSASEGSARQGQVMRLSLIHI